MRNTGLTLIEIMVVVALIAIIASFAIPKLLESKKTVNENSAVSNLRTISSAEEFYNTRYQRYGSLAQLSDANLIDPFFAAATTVASAKSGYYYTLYVSGSGNAWSCISRPAEWDVTGERNFMVDQKGIIYVNLTDGGTTWNKSLGEK